ncbi:MAG: membrane protein insertase YidC [Fibrobacteria bacterium]|nr:membrane protein insertase YidC [Fibrobacteria bacterium]
MGKNRIVGWLIITLLFLVWMTYNSRVQQEKLAEKRTADSILALSDTSQKRFKETTGEIPILKQPSILHSTAIQGDSANQALAGDSIEHIERQHLVFETNEFIIGFDNQCACITSIQVKSLKGKTDTTYPQIIPQDKGGALSISLGGIDFSNIVWKVKGNHYESTRLEEGQETLEFTHEVVPGKTISRIYTLYADSQKITHKFLPENAGTKYGLLWKAGMEETEEMPTGKGFGLNYSFFSEVTYHTLASIERKSFKEPEKINEDAGVIKWVGLRRKYVAALINFKRNTHNVIYATPLINKDEKNENAQHSYSLEILGNEWENGALDFDFYVLPLQHKSLISHGEGYEQILFSGWEWVKGDYWFVKLCGGILWLLNKFYSLIPNYGIAIILLTLLVRLILFPLTIAQTKSMSKMQAHSPAIKEIKEKNRGNPQKANKEVMEYYRTQGINPAAQMFGCFPMLLQFPVFIALFIVLGRALELKEAFFFAWISDLSRPDVLVEALKIPYLFPQGLTILPFFMAITMYFQTKATITDPNQKAMVYMMPVMMFFFSASFPSGLVLYWTISNVFTIVQTVLVKRKIPAPKIISLKKDGSPKFKKKKKR